MKRQIVLSLLLLSTLCGCSWQGSKPSFDPLSICGPRRIAAPPTGSCRPNEAYYQTDVTQPVITMPGPAGSTTIPPSGMIPSSNPAPLGNPATAPTTPNPPGTLQPLAPPIGTSQRTEPDAVQPIASTVEWSPGEVEPTAFVNRTTSDESPIRIVENPSYQTAERPADPPAPVNGSAAPVQEEKWIELSRLPRLSQSEPVRGNGSFASPAASADGWKSHPVDLRPAGETPADGSGPRCTLAAVE